jgi:septum formation inhibitor MinC
MAHQTSNGSSTAFITSLTPEPEQVDIDRNKRSEEKAIARDIKEDEYYSSLEEALTS